MILTVLVKLYLFGETAVERALPARHRRSGNCERAAKPDRVSGHGSETETIENAMSPRAKTLATLAVICAAFTALAVTFLAEPPGPPTGLYPIHSWTPTSLTPTPCGAPMLIWSASRRTCRISTVTHGPHPGQGTVLRFDTNQNLIIPKAHSDIVMGHGSRRNDNCYNCHNETNLLLLQTRDGHEL